MLELPRQPAVGRVLERIDWRIGDARGHEATVGSRRIATPQLPLPGIGNRLVSHPIDSLFVRVIAGITRPPPILWSFDQRTLLPYRVEMHVAADCPKVLFVLNQLPFISSLEQMPGALMPLGEPVGIP